MLKKETGKKNRGILPTGLLGTFLFLVLYPFFFPPAYFLSMLYMVFLYVVLAESWNIISGFAGYLSFGHVAFFGIGAYTTAFLMNRLGSSLFATMLSSIPGGFVAALVAFLIGYPSLRLRGPYFAVVTRCFAFIVHMVIQNIGILGGVEGLWLPAMKLPISTIRAIFYETMLGLMVLVVLLVRWIERSKLGLGLVIIREDEEVAQTLGIHTHPPEDPGFWFKRLHPGNCRGARACLYPPRYAFFTCSLSINSEARP